MMTRHGADTAIKILKYLGTDGILKRLLAGLMNIFSKEGQEICKKELSSIFENVLAKYSKKDLITGALSSTDGAA
jgi:hypothetical protein